MIEKNTPIVSAADKYLDSHGHTNAAYEHVNHVYSTFEFMVRLATNRALEQLLPAQNEPTEAVILQFPTRGKPDGAA